MINKTQRIWIFFLAVAMVLLPSAILAAQKTMTVHAWDRVIDVSVINPDFTYGASIVINKPNVITIEPDPSNPTSNTVILGNGISDACGAIWLGGTGTTNSFCSENKCDFMGGFHFYFEFKISPCDSHASSTDWGDGFTFAMINAANNDRNRRGGPASESRGELLCYAGSDNTANQRGLDYPKMAIEFDTYPNRESMTAYGCLSGRADAGVNNHIAAIFWGGETTGNCTNNNRHLCISYDDNIHGIPSSASDRTPRNSARDDGTGGYYERPKATYHWLEDNVNHLARVEVIRNPATHTYNIKVWVDCESPNGSSACSIAEINDHFKNVTETYYNTLAPRSGSVAPKIDRTVALDSSLPSFDKLLYGFTVGTGEKTQTVILKNFKMHFLADPNPCLLTINPASRNAARTPAGNGTIAVSVGDDCQWSASSNASWLNIQSGSNSVGPGQITYQYTANSAWFASERTGVITVRSVAGTQTFTLNQAGR